CRPALLKADRRLLSRTGGLAIDLEKRRVRTVAETQGEHGWWRGAADDDAHALRRSSGQALRPGSGHAPTDLTGAGGMRDGTTPAPARAEPVEARAKGWPPAP
ncbi:MAG: hypothetical protein WCY29_07000, partial [Novosphingobium sp.]